MHFDSTIASHGYLMYQTKKQHDASMRKKKNKKNKKKKKKKKKKSDKRNNVLAVVNLVLQITMIIGYPMFIIP